MGSNLLGRILHPKPQVWWKGQHCLQSMVLVKTQLAIVSHWFGSGEVTQDLVPARGYSGPGWSLMSPSLQISLLDLPCGPATLQLAMCPWQLPALGR